VPTHTGVRVVADPSVDAVLATEQVRALLAESDLPRPFVLAGSDAGALFAVGLVATGGIEVDALILAGLPVATAGSAAEPVSWDDEVAARTSCPTHQGRLTADENLSRGAIYTALPDSWFARADLSAVDVPVLGLHGAADEISPLAQARSEYARAGHAELISITDGKHDAFNDATHRTAAGTVVLFLERLRLGAQLPAIAVRENL